VIYIAPTTSIQAMLGGDAQFTGAGTSALVASRAPAPIESRRGDQRPGICNGLSPGRTFPIPKSSRAKGSPPPASAAIATFMLKQILTKYGLDGQ
jgi:hypothetical protein